ncbi:MAG TPA: toll/interleukin-1 receptor domain-containing protein [Phototrophicaceae bacterium]|jgi:hypothetical protein|nr:toll/interleukin-1 receptor domain-containing protein [Phototrophicaceae bacterium]
MVTPVTDQNPHPQTMEQQRARIQRELIAAPQNAELRKTLMELCTVDAIRQAGRRGVFIGYSRSDELFAIDLAADLRTKGVDVWMDMIDVSYDEDGDWGTEIMNALSRSGLMLLVVSEEALKDRELQRERDHFVQNGKIVLPVMYESGNYDLRAYLPALDLRYYERGLQTLVRLFAR